MTGTFTYSPALGTVLPAGPAQVLSVVFTLPHHLDPSGGYADPLRTTAIQRLLPLETNQDYTWFLKGEPPPPAP